MLEHEGIEGVAIRKDPKGTYDLEISREGIVSKAKQVVEGGRSSASSRFDSLTSRLVPEIGSKTQQELDDEEKQQQEPVLSVSEDDDEGPGSDSGDLSAQSEDFFTLRPGGQNRDMEVGKRGSLGKKGATGKAQGSTAAATSRGDQRARCDTQGNTTTGRGDHRARSEHSVASTGRRGAATPAAGLVTPMPNVRGRKRRPRSTDKALDIASGVGTAAKRVKQEGEYQADAPDDVSSDKAPLDAQSRGSRGSANALTKCSSTGGDEDSDSDGDGPGDGPSLRGSCATAPLSNHSHKTSAAAPATPNVTAGPSTPAVLQKKDSLRTQATDHLGKLDTITAADLWDKKAKPDVVKKLITKATELAGKLAVIPNDTEAP